MYRNDNNSRRTLHVIEQVKQKKNTETLIVELDAEKPFDSVRWFFLYKVFGKFAIHNKFIRVLTVPQSLYSRPTAWIKINSELSASFALERGTPQGCPISPIQFALFIEPLGQLIRQRSEIKGVTIAGVGHKMAMFADDVLVYMEEAKKQFIDLTTY